MRRNYLLIPIAIILAGLGIVQHLSIGRTQPPRAPGASSAINNDSNQTASNASFALRGTTLLTTPVTEAMREEQRQQIIHYFEAQIAATPAKRDALWRTNFASLSAYQASVEPHRAHLREMLGLVNAHVGTAQTKLLNESASLEVEDVTLPMESGLTARALVFLPKSVTLAGGVIAIPPATESREEFAGVMEGAKPAAWLKTLLARSLAVAVPITIERGDDHPICLQAGGKDRRRVLWRAGFIVGRTMVGLEVQQALALRQYLALRRELAAKPIAIMGRDKEP